MREVFANSTLRAGIRTFRASSPRWFHKKGDRFGLGHATSTSVNRSFAGSWAEAKVEYFDGSSTLWVIDCPPGTHAIWGTTNNQEESEVILAHDQQVEVIDAWRDKHHPSYGYMHVRVIPESAPESAADGAIDAIIAGAPPRIRAEVARLLRGLSLTPIQLSKVQLLMALRAKRRYTNQELLAALSIFLRQSGAA